MIDLGTRESMRNYVIALLSKGKRVDRRKLTEYRKIKIQTGYIKTAEGSAYVELGNTKVLAGVKFAVEEPFPDMPEDGIFIVSVEYSPIAHPTIEAGPPGPDAIEVSRVVDRAIRESHMIDTKKLCIEPGKWVWTMFIDIYVLNHDGNLIDAATLAAVSALKTAKLPKLEKVNDEYVVNNKELTDQPVPLNTDVVNITLAKIGDHIIVDPSKIEEETADVILIVGVSREGKIHSLQTRKADRMKPEELMNMIKIAMRKSKELFKVLDQAIQ